MLLNQTNPNASELIQSFYGAQAARGLNSSYPFKMSVGIWMNWVKILNTTFPAIIGNSSLSTEEKHQQIFEVSIAFISHNIGFANKSIFICVIEDGFGYFGDYLQCQVNANPSRPVPFSLNCASPFYWGNSNLPWILPDIPCPPATTTPPPTTTTPLPCGSCTMDQLTLTQGPESWQLPYTQSGIITNSNGCKKVAIYCNKVGSTDVIHHGFNNGEFFGQQNNGYIGHELWCENGQWNYINYTHRPVHEVSCIEYIPPTTTPQTPTTTSLPCGACTMDQLTLTQGPEEWQLPYTKKGIQTIQSNGCTYMNIFCNNSVDPTDVIQHSFNNGEWLGQQNNGNIGHTLWCENAQWTQDHKPVHEISCIEYRPPTTTPAPTTPIPCGACTLDQLTLTQGPESWQLPYTTDGIRTYADGCKHVAIFCNKVGSTDVIQHSFNNGEWLGQQNNGYIGHSLRCENAHWILSNKTVHEISCIDYVPPNPQSLLQMLTSS